MWGGTGDQDYPQRSAVRTVSFRSAPDFPGARIAQLPTVNILLDCSAIKEGGGVQLALNFLDLLREEPPAGYNVYTLVPADGLLHKAVTKSSLPNVLLCPQGYVSRFLFEHVKLREIMAMEQIKVIYTFFGAGLPHPAEVTSIVTVAYPIICYPESPYWQLVDAPSRIGNQLRNWIRRRRLRNADLILVETPVMLQRLERHVGIDASRVKLLPPAVSEYVRARSVNSLPHSPMNFLFVSGTAFHKNLWRLYAVGQQLRDKGVKPADARFLLTVTRDDYLASLQEASVDSSILDDYFEFLGGLHSSELMGAYERASYLVSLSDLESFSNNYMEAWKVGVPIIASDRDFARSICGESALYVEPHDPEAVADTIIQCKGDPSIAARLVAAGQLHIGALPTTRDRFQKIFSYIDPVT